MLRFASLLVISLVPALSLAQSLTFETSEDGAWVSEGGEKVLFYQAKTKSLDGAYPRANYIHPLYNVDGVELTEDFPKDHLHHRGIFWTWHQVRIGEHTIGDAWECKDFVWDVMDISQSKLAKGSLTFKVKTHWLSPLWVDQEGKQKPFMEENTRITVYIKERDYRVIDFEISLLALEKNLMIGGSDDNKGYGGFSVRMKLPEDIKFNSSNGEVAPTVGPVKAGAWMNVSGALAADGGNAGVVMICHPDNPMYPEQWILRAKRSMQNPAYPGRNPVPVSDQEATVLRYRLVVYTGTLTKDKIRSLNEFNSM